MRASCKEIFFSEETRHPQQVPHLMLRQFQFVLHELDGDVLRLGLVLLLEKKLPLTHLQHPSSPERDFSEFAASESPADGDVLVADLPAVPSDAAAQNDFLLRR